jgi:hypothetical protein
MPSIEDLRNYFYTAKLFIGEDWLEEQRKRYFSKGGNTTDSPPPIISQYHQSFFDLEIEERDDIEELFFPSKGVSETSFRFINIGRFIADIGDGKISDPDGSYLDKSLSAAFAHRLRNPDEYEKALFELQIGAGYSREGYDVSFIEEGEQKAPDILIEHDGTNIYLECKRCDRSTGEQQERGGLYESLITKVESLVNSESITVIELDRLPEMEEIHSLEEHLSKNPLRPQCSEKLPFGRIYLYKFRNTEIKRLPQYNLDIIEQSNLFYNQYVSPIIYSKFGPKGSVSELFEKGHLDAEIAKDPGGTKFRNVRWIGVRYPYDADLINPVLKQFDSAYGKFSKDHPNILHIDVPYLKDYSQEDAQELINRIGGQLNVKKRIASEIINKDSDKGFEYGHQMGKVDNYDPYQPMPEDFELPCSDLEDLISEIPEES